MNRILVRTWLAAAVMMPGYLLFAAEKETPAAVAAPAKGAAQNNAPKPAVQNPAPKPALKPAPKPAPRRRQPTYGMWGVNVDAERMVWPLLTEEFMLAEELGVSMVRVTFDWAIFAPNPRNRDVNRFKAVVEEAMRRRLKVVGVFGGRLPDYVKKPHAIIPGAKEFDEAQFDAYLEYVETVVKNFSGKIRFWEVCDHLDPALPIDRQHQFADAVAAAIRKIDSSATVLPPAVPADDVAQQRVWQGNGTPFAVKNRTALRASLDPEIVWTSPKNAKARPQGNFWVTSVGLPGGAANYPGRYLVKELFRAAEASPFVSELLLIADPRYNCYTEQYNFRRSDFGRFRRVREVTLADVAKLQPERSQLLIAPPHMELPPDQVEVLVQFVKRGGNLMIPHDNDHLFTPAILARLHIGLEQPGSYDRVLGGPGCPEMPKTLARIDPVTLQGLTPYKLPPGDRFKSLVQLSSSKVATTVVGLYTYGSDFKGRLLLVRGHSDYFGGGCTPDMQARRLPRDLILWRIQGASKIFYHKMTALEESPEVPQHYGLLTRNYIRKPAYFAYQTLIRMMPDGSSRPSVVQRNGDFFLVSWQRPDKTTVYALWSRLNGRSVKLLLPPGGKIAEAYTFTGQRFTLNPESVWINDGVTYFVAPPGVKFQLK